MAAGDRRFPRVSEYLAALPRGADSYPECQSKASLLRHMQASLPFELAPGELPEAVHALWASPPPVSAWVPTVPFMALMLAYGDAHFAEDADFGEWLYGLSAALYAKPLYRFLMYVSSPKRLTRGVAKRWHQFHRGTELEVDEEGEGWVVLKQTFPPRLNSRRLLKTNLPALRAAIVAAGGREVTETLLDTSDTHGRMRFTWQ